MNIAKIMIPKVSIAFLYENNTIRQGLERRIDWMKSSLGLANVHQRIRTIYGPEYGLSIDSGPDGTVVLLRFPAGAVRQEPSPEGGQGAGRGNAS